MKGTIIKKVSVKPLRARLNQPFKIATGAHNELENVLLEIELANGVKGFGEAAPAAHITGETQAATLANLKEAARFLPGSDAASFMHISCAVKERYPDNACARTAVEMALLDAVTRSAGIPLWKMFGPSCVPLNIDMTVVLGSVEEAGLDARNIYKRGIRAFKIKIGNDPETDFQRVLAVAKVAGKCPVYLDANQGFNSDTMLAFLKKLKGKGVVPAFVEQPVAKDDWDGLKRVTRLGGVCVGADESVTCLADVVRVIREKAAHAVNIKTAKFGLLEGAEMARVASAAGLKLMAGGMMESLLSMGASAHMAAGMGCFNFIDLDTPLFVRDRVMKGNILRPHGEYDLSKVRAGIGVVPA